MEDSSPSASDTETQEAPGEAARPLGAQAAEAQRRITECHSGVTMSQLFTHSSLVCLGSVLHYRGALSVQ